MRNGFGALLFTTTKNLKAGAAILLDRCYATFCGCDESKCGLLRPPGSANVAEGISKANSTRTASAMRYMRRYCTSTRHNLLNCRYSYDRPASGP